jgi:hypothetical protein
MIQLDCNAEERILPKQSLEGKFAKIAKIISVRGCNQDGKYNNKSVHTADHVGVFISNRTDTTHGSSKMVFNHPTFEFFKRGYGVESYEDLIGEPVISVYTESGSMLSGLIPLNLKLDSSQ